MATNWLDAKGYLSRNERVLLHTLAHIISRRSAHAQARVLNIGIEYGASMAALSAALQSKDVLYGVDTSLKPYIKHDYQDPYNIVEEVDSHKLIAAWTLSIDLLFVDGDHSYEGVLQDAQFCRYITKGGFVAFHDCITYNDYDVSKYIPGVNKAVTEWFAANANDWSELDPADSIRAFQRV